MTTLSKQETKLIQCPYCTNQAVDMLEKIGFDVVKNKGTGIKTTISEYLCAVCGKAFLWAKKEAE